VQQVSTRLGEVEGAWLEAQMAGGRTVREIVEGLIRQAIAGPAQERRTIRVAGRDRRHRLREHQGRVLRQERQRAGRLQRDLTIALAAFGKARSERGDLMAGSATLRAELAAAGRAQEQAEKSLAAFLRRDQADDKVREQGIAQALQQFRAAVFPHVATIMEGIATLSRGGWAQADQMAATARDLQQIKDAHQHQAEIETVAADTYVMGREDEFAHRPLPDAVAARVVAKDRDHPLLRREREAVAQAERNSARVNYANYKRARDGRVATLPAPPPPAAPTP